MLRNKYELLDEVARLKRNFVLSSLESDLGYAEEVLAVARDYLLAVKGQIGIVKNINWFYEVYIDRCPWGSKGVEFRTGVRKLPVVPEVLEPGGHCNPATTANGIGGVKSTWSPKNGHAKS